MNNLATLLGRIGLALIFIVSGWSKISDYAGTQQYMDAMGVPSLLLPIVIAAELLGGLAVLSGFATRYAALGLAVFSLASAFLFHTAAGDQNQAIHFMKNIAIVGGFLVLAAHGAGRFSVDDWLQRRRTRA